MDGIKEIKKQERDGLLEHYGKLVGYRVVDVRIEDDEDGWDRFPILTFRQAFKNSETGATEWHTFDAVVSRDPEENGGGHMNFYRTSHKRYQGED
jgi:hypothetical protein